MDAIERGEQLMMEMENRYVSVYDAALRRAVRNIRAFLQKVKDVQSGKIKPPQFYVDRDEVDKWREGFLKELARQLHVVENIAAELNAAGGQAAEIIRDGLDEVYAVNRTETVDAITAAVDRRGFAAQPTFAMMDKRAIRIAIEDAQPVFSEIAYDKLGNNVAARRRLQNTLAEALALGEDQDKILRRIRRITLQTTKQARRVAQTELTRVRSQARYEAGQEAVQQGVSVYNTWSTRMDNSRESHIMLNGKKAMQGDAFPDSVLRYPGDPTAPAREVINCHCVLVPDVLLPGERLENGRIVGGD